jgi:hypothetical protein
MPMIFPGMDPYLEHPLLWPSVHSRLIVYLADQLGPRIRPRYSTTIEERVYVEESDRSIIPDIWIKKNRPEAPRSDAATALADVDIGQRVQVASLEVRETYIEIVDLYRQQQVVTVIEVVSPANKCPGEGEQSYRKKQREVLHSGIHLVEIDLLRSGNHVVAVPNQIVHNSGPYDYLISINRAVGLRDEFEFFHRRLQQRLPRIPIPLQEGDSEAPLDIQAAVEQVYDAGGYLERIDYGQPCVPPLNHEDQGWADQLIREKHGRGQKL